MPLHIPFIDASIQLSAMPRLAFALMFLTCFTPGVLAQTPAPPATPQARATAPGRLRVFLDCDCFPEYLRTEIQWVDFVRQSQDADVHVLSTTSDTGGGGREVVLRFVGIGRLQGVDQSLRAVSLTADSEDVQRRNILRTISVGLLGYIAREGLPTDVNLTVRATAPDQAAAVARDPWRAWVFGLEGSSSLDREEANSEMSWDLGATADRITDMWKISFGAEIDQEIEEFDLDEDDPFKVTRRERSADGFVARSLGPHWSLGFDGRVESSTFGNVQFAADFAPAIEFSVWPYAEYATRQLRIAYEIGATHARYNEVTLYDKMRETLGRHAVSATLDQRQPWGSLQAQVEWSQFLHDFTKYRLEVEGQVSLRIVRGLSIDFEGFASRVRDQLSLPRRSATQEEVLLRLRELQSGYQIGMSFGLRYSFGSIFNNVVNPRFGS